MSAKPLDRVGIARALRDVASLLALAGEEPFRARAYERAAGTLERLDVDLAVLIDAGRLTEIPGIGRGLAAVIEELYTTGRSKVLDALRKRLPPGALELSRVPGLSLTRIAALHAALGVETIADLREACEAGTGARGPRHWRKDRAPNPRGDSTRSAGTRRYDSTFTVRWLSPSR